MSQKLPPKPTRFLGPLSNMNLLVVAEGFKTSNMSDFHDACSLLKSAIEGESWYALGDVRTNFTLWKCALKSGNSPIMLDFARADCDYYVEAGAQMRPAVSFSTKLGVEGCHSVAGTAAVSTFVSKLSSSFATQGVPKFKAVVVLVNSPILAGLTTAEAAWCTIARGFEGWAIHELGHIFGLDDEYEPFDGRLDLDPGDGATVKGNGNNVIGKNYAELAGRVPWQDATGLAFALPEEKGQCLNAVVPLAGSAPIGIYEGAGNFHCLCYRPGPKCRMREPADDFCDICRDVLAAYLDTTGLKDPAYVK